MSNLKDIFNGLDLHNNKLVNAKVDEPTHEDHVVSQKFVDSKTIYNTEKAAQFGDPFKLTWVTNPRNKSFLQLFDDVFFPQLNPEYVNPTFDQFTTVKKDPNIVFINTTNTGFKVNWAISNSDRILNQAPQIVITKTDGNVLTITADTTSLIGEKSFNIDWTLIQKIEFVAIFNPTTIVKQDTYGNNFVPPDFLAPYQLKHNILADIQFSNLIVPALFYRQILPNEDVETVVEDTMVINSSSQLISSMDYIRTNQNLIVTEGDENFFVLLVPKIVYDDYMMFMNGNHIPESVLTREEIMYVDGVEFLLTTMDLGVYENQSVINIIFKLKDGSIDDMLMENYYLINELGKIDSIYLDIVNDLQTGGIDRILSAEQGKFIGQKIQQIENILASDDINLDTIQEIIDAIKEVQMNLETILVNNLTDGGITKALTAEMGKLLQANKVDKVDGSRLINTAEIQKLNSLVNFVISGSANRIQKVNAAGDDLEDSAIEETTEKVIIDKLLSLGNDDNSGLQFRDIKQDYPFNYDNANALSGNYEQILAAPFDSQIFLFSKSLGRITVFYDYTLGTSIENYLNRTDLLEMVIGDNETFFTTNTEILKYVGSFQPFVTLANIKRCIFSTWDNELLAIVSGESKVFKINTSDGTVEEKFILTAEPKDIFVSDSIIIVSYENSNDISFFDLSTGNPEIKLTLDHPAKLFTGYTWSKIIISDGVNNVSVFNYDTSGVNPTFEKIDTIQYFGTNIKNILLTAGNETLYIFSATGNVEILDLDSRQFTNQTSQSIQQIIEKNDYLFGLDYNIIKRFEITPKIKVLGVDTKGNVIPIDGVVTQEQLNTINGMSLLGGIDMIIEGGSEITGNAGSIPKYNDNGDNLDESAIYEDQNNVNFEKPVRLFEGALLENVKSGFAPDSQIITGIGQYPFMVVANRAGEMFVSVSGNIVQKIALDGTVSEYFVSEYAPQFLAIDPDDDTVYAMNQSGNITKYETNGTKTIFNFTNMGLREFKLDSQKNMFILNYGAGNIIKITPDGTTSMFYEIDPMESNPQMYGMVFDSNDNLFVCTSSTHRVLKFTPDGVMSEFAVTEFAPNRIIIDSSGNLYTCNSNSVINKISPSGQTTQFASGLPFTPQFIALDFENNLYAVGNSNNYYLKFDQEGNFTQVPVAQGATNVNSDQFGNVYIVDQNAQNIIAIRKKAVSNLLTTDSDGNVIKNEDIIIGSSIDIKKQIVLSKAISTDLQFDLPNKVTTKKPFIVAPDYYVASSEDQIKGSIFKDKEGVIWFGSDTESWIWANGSGTYLGLGATCIHLCEGPDEWIYGLMRDGRVIKINRFGNYSFLFQGNQDNPTFTSPISVIYRSNKLIAVYSGGIYELNLETQTSSQLKALTNQSQFTNYIDLVKDSQNNVYQFDAWDGKVYRIGTDNAINEFIYNLSIYDIPLNISLINEEFIYFFYPNGVKWVPLNNPAQINSYYPNPIPDNNLTKGGVVTHDGNFVIALSGPGLLFVNPFTNLVLRFMFSNGEILDPSKPITGIFKDSDDNIFITEGRALYRVEFKSNDLVFGINGAKTEAIQPDVSRKWVNGRIKSLMKNEISKLSTNPTEPVEPVETVDTSFLDYAPAINLFYAHDRLRPNIKLDLTENILLQIVDTVNGDSGIVNFTGALGRTIKLLGTETLEFVSDEDNLFFFFINNGEDFTWFRSYKTAPASNPGITKQTVTGNGTTQNVDLKNGTLVNFTFGAGNQILTFDNPNILGDVTLIVKQDSVGSRTLTLPSTFGKIAGASPVLSTGPNKVDLLKYTFDGQFYYPLPIVNDIQANPLNTYTVVARVNAGDSVAYPASDGGVPWEANPDGAIIGTNYSCNAFGESYTIDPPGYTRHASIPSSVDTNEFNKLFEKQRYSGSNNMPLYNFAHGNGEYKARLYVAEQKGETALYTGIIPVVDGNFGETYDLFTLYGAGIAVMIELDYTVTNGSLNLELVKPPGGYQEVSIFAIEVLKKVQ